MSSIPSAKPVLVIAALGFAVVMVSLTPSLAQRTPTAPPTRPGGCDAVCQQQKVDRHLLVMGQVGNDEDLQRSLRGLRELGPGIVRVVHETFNHWSRATQTDARFQARPGEMRWRAVYLLGELGIPDAIPLLYAIAREPLPEPRCTPEQVYADEYRVRLRAIAGLETLKAVDELKDLHEIGGVLVNPTAASLFLLGVDVGGVSRIDARTALEQDTADAKDYHPSQGRPAQREKPGAAKAPSVKRRPDTPAVRNQ